MNTYHVQVFIHNTTINQDKFLIMIMLVINPSFKSTKILQHYNTSFLCFVFADCVEYSKIKNELIFCYFGNKSGTNANRIVLNFK